MPDKHTFPMPERLVAIGDLQGNLEGLETILQRQVSHAGYVDLPLVERRVKASGLTQQELVEAVKDAYRRLFRDNDAAMTERLSDLRRTYAHVDAVTRLCDALAAAADGVHGRALELTRPDDKRATVP